MKVTKCDICKKKIGAKEDYIWLMLNGENYGSFEICTKCGAVVIKLLEGKNLIKPNKKS